MPKKKEPRLTWNGSNQAYFEHIAACTAHPPRNKVIKKRKKKLKPKKSNRILTYADLGFPSYSAYLLGKWWRNRRQQKLISMNYQCEKCGSIQKLQVHHLNYKRLGREKDKDLQVLCEG